MISSATPFEAEISYRFGRAAKRRACLLLEELALPVPRDRDYLPGKESLHIFLQQHGLLLRFGERSRARVSDRVLQPLHRSTLGDNADFELLPGIRVGGTTADKLRLKMGLLRQGENFPRSEMVRSNIGHIGMKAERPHVLVIDRCAIVPLASTFNASSEADRFKSFRQLAPVQDAYFHDLREHAAQVFTEVSGEVDDEAKARMFAFCRHQVALPDESADKCLSNSWVMPGIVRPRHIAITIAAQEYALRYA